MEKISIIDFGSQYTQLIARKVRELGVYCDITAYNSLKDPDDDIKGIILSGSPFSVSQSNAPRIALDKYLNRFPVLGICYGAQLMADTFGGQVEKSNHREYGKAALTEVVTHSRLFASVDEGSQVWMSHGDTITQLPSNATLLAKTNSIPHAAFELTGYSNPVYGIQFHPEVYHSLQGKNILKNFVIDVCQCTGNWTPDAFVEGTTQEIKNIVGDDKVLMGLSGGVDSSVAATLIHKAIGNRLYCFFIDNGLLRKNEYEEVLASYEGQGLNIFGIDAKDDFLNALAGISDPETKRKTIGRVFLEVFEREAKKIEGIKWLGQGTIYPDVIESVSVHGPSAVIKSHHNVGGLPDKMDLKVLEPLRKLFKDEVRNVGKAMGLPNHLIGRHPFPGPGLAIRILGDISPAKVKLLQDADYIYINALKEHGLYDKVWQAGTILLPIQSVGVMGDERTYEQVVALRAVNSTDGMTAEWSNLPYEFLAEVSNKIINQVKGINRVVYDISTKPPATIEWE